MSDLLRLASLLEESLFKMLNCISRSVGSHIYGPRYDSIKNVCLETCHGACDLFYLHAGAANAGCFHFSFLPILLLYLHSHFFEALRTNMICKLQ